MSYVLIKQRESSETTLTVRPKLYIELYTVYKYGISYNNINYMVL